MKDMEKFSQILLLVLIGFTGYGLGRKLFRLLKIRFHCLTDEIISSIALGWGALAYSVLALGLLSLLHRWVAYGLLGLVALISISEVRTLLLTLRSNSARSVRNKFLNGSSKVTDESISRAFKVSLFFLLGATLAVSFIGALTPPLNYDTLSYHLGVPRLYIRYHQIMYLPHQVYSNFPFTLEMLYTLSLLLKGDILAKLIHLSFGLLTVGAIYCFSRRYFDQKISLLAAGIFYNIPLVGFLSTTAYIDLGATLFQFLALTGLINWFYSGRRDDFIRSALFCGLAIGTKYPAVLLSFFPLLLGIVIKMAIVDKSRWSTTLKRVTAFSLLALGVACPWFIKNLAYTANPIYPLFYNFLGGRDWSAFNASRFMKHHSASFGNWWEMFKVSLDISKSKDIGPLFIIFAPLMIFFKRFKKPIKLLLTYGGLYFLLWIFFTHGNCRFLLPALPAISLIAAYLMTRFRKRKVDSLLLVAGLGLALALNYERILLLWLHLLNLREEILLVPLSLGLSGLVVFLAINCLKRKSFSALIVAGFALVMLINFVVVAAMIPRHGLLRVAFGRESREKFLSRTFYAYDAFRFCNERLPQSAKILFIGENQGYYCERDFLSNSPLDDNIMVGIVNSACSGAEIRERLKEMDITYILYNASEVKRVDMNYSSFNWADEEEEARFRHFLFSGEYLRLLFFKGGVFVYELF